MIFPGQQYNDILLHPRLLLCIPKQTPLHGGMESMTQRRVDCFIAMKQSLHRDEAIAHTCTCNEYD